MYWSTILYFVSIGLLIISIILSISVKSTFKRLSKKKNARGITGVDAAEQILRTNGVYDVYTNPTSGTLSDFYDPRSKSVNLSEGVYDGASIAAVAVAAHECGHAIQHNEGYTPIVIRNYILPVAQLGTHAGIILFIVGMIFAHIDWLMDVGIALFAFAVLFHLLTLRIEIDASRRGLKALTQSNILYEEEMPQAKKMLRVAAYTYVAAAASAAIQLLRLIAIRNRR